MGSICYQKSRQHRQQKKMLQDITSYNHFFAHPALLHTMRGARWKIMEIFFKLQINSQVELTWKERNEQFCQLYH